MQESKLNKKSLKALETKRKIYESAHILFIKHGFENVSVDAIVKEANVAKGSFYVHFESKNTLIANMITDHVNKMDLDYRTHLELCSPDEKASNTLISLAVKTADAIEGAIGYDLMKIIYEVLITRSVNGNAIINYSRDLYILFNTVITRGVQQGEFKTDISVDVLSRHCVSAIRGLAYEWCIRYPELNLKDAIKEHFTILLNGIKIL